jgi:chromodomain-helicase-DNA-binding protein 7
MRVLSSTSQAQARVHRIGQKKSVKIYRLITRKTYEQHMFHRASLKLGLEVAVMDQMRQRQGSKGLLGDGKEKPGATSDKLSTAEVSSGVTVRDCCSVCVRVCE